MFRRPRSLLTLLALGVSIACTSSSEPAAPDDSVFVRTMGELRRIKTDPSLDSMARDSAREATLRAHGVTPDELEALARALAADPERALAEWREIESIAKGNSAAAAPTPRKPETP